MAHGAGRWKAVAAVLVGAALLAFMALRLIPSRPADLDLSLDKATSKNLYAVAIEPESGTFSQNQMHAWLVTVRSEGGAPVAGAKIAVDGGMPEHGHGLPTAPQASEIGGGKYRIEGVRFNMGGWWELRLAISAAAGTDDVVFNLQL